MDIPSNRTINKRRVASFYTAIHEAVKHPKLEQYASVVQQFQTESQLPIEQIAAALAALIHGDVPLLLTEELRPSEFADSRPTNDSFRARPDQRSFAPNGSRPNDPRNSAPRAPGVESFRIEVGHAHQVKPGNIVGAIAGESGLQGSMIGRIEIFEDYSIVDLPEGMPREIFRTLKKTWVVGRQLNISRLDDPRTAPRANGEPEEAPRAKKKPKRDKAAAGV